MASGEGRIVRSNGFTALKCGEGRMVAIPLTENCRPYEDYVSEAGLERQGFDWVIRTYITRYCTASFHLYQRLHWQGPLGQRNISRLVIFYSLLRSKLPCDRSASLCTGGAAKADGRTSARCHHEPQV